MEFLITVAVVVVLMLLLGFGVFEIALLAAALTVIGGFFVFVMFSYSLFRMVTAEKVDAVFTKTAKPPKRNFEAAHYKCRGVEYPCAFPGEPLMRKRIYTPDKTYKVSLNRRTKRVYDRYAKITCIIGFVFCGFFTASAGWLIYIVAAVGTKGV